MLKKLILWILFFGCRCENLCVERNWRRNHKEDEDDYLEKLKLKTKKKSNVKLKEKVPRLNFQEQMIGLQEMQLKAFEEFFMFFMELAKVLSK